LRATYGTSYKVPSVYQLNEFNGFHSLQNLASPAGTTRTIVRLGNSSGLHEETATAWTAGADFVPRSVRGFRAQFTYYDIEHEGRIQFVAASNPTIFNDPIYELLVTRRGDIPDAEFDALVAELLSGSLIVSGCAVPIDPATRACPEPVTNFNAVIDRRLFNLDGAHTSGIDLLLSQRIDARVGTFDLGLNANYVFDYEQKITLVAPSVDFVDTVGLPLDLRVRAAATWSRGGLAVTGTVNYTDDYRTGEGVAPGTGLPVTPAGIKSWTTVDVNVHYGTAGRFSSRWLDNAALSLTVTNLFDEDPPFFADQSAGLGYDPANADPLGRFISLSLTKNW